LGRIGTLSIDDNSKESRLDGVLLVVGTSGDAPGDATAYLENNNFADGDQADVEGTDVKWSGKPAINMKSAKPVPEAVKTQAAPCIDAVDDAVAEAPDAVPDAPKKAATKKASKRPATKK
jgi:hypothetical protein